VPGCRQQNVRLASSSSREYIGQDLGLPLEQQGVDSKEGLEHAGQAMDNDIPETEMNAMTEESDASGLENIDEEKLIRLMTM
jgi:hypothetical protein